MPISLYDATVPTFLQSLGGLAAVLDQGQAHCRQTGADADSLLEVRLVDDMLPLRFQIQSVVHHSKGALEGAEAGVFRPDRTLRPLDYAGMQALVAETQAALQAVPPEAVNALEGRQVLFEGGELKLPFLAEDFLLTFSLPNLYFHAATAYDILRLKGVPLSKRHFLGRPRVMQPVSA